MATVYPALGTTLSFDPVTPTTYVAIGNILSIDGAAEFGTQETTNLSSTTKTFRSTLLDPGEITVEVELDPGDTTHAALWTAFLAGTKHLWKITFPDAAPTTRVCNGYITKFDDSAGGPEDNLTAKLTIKRTGAFS